MARKTRRDKTDFVKEPIKLDERGKEILAMITALEDEDKLNAWEQEFVASISDRFLGKCKELTPAQYDRLKIIYRKWY